eukprot:364796-Chlamydomonas_euryale.AAC.10
MGGGYWAWMQRCLECARVRCGVLRFSMRLRSKKEGTVRDSLTKASPQPRRRGAAAAAAVAAAAVGRRREGSPRRQFSRPVGGAERRRRSAIDPSARPIRLSQSIDSPGGAEGA